MEVSDSSSSSAVRVSLKENVRRHIALFPIEEPLKTAIMCGEIGKVRKILKGFGELPATQRTGGPQSRLILESQRAYLHFAVLVGEASCLPVATMIACELKWQLEQHLSVTYREHDWLETLPSGTPRPATFESGSPLHLAVQLRQYRMVEMLLGFVEDVNISLNESSGRPHPKFGDIDQDSHAWVSGRCP